MEKVWPGIRAHRLVVSPGLACALGLGLLPLGAAPQASAAAPALSGLRASAAVTLTAGCGDHVQSADLAHNIEQQLASLGVTISTIHNTQFSVVVDCTPVPAKRTETSINECLGVDELVSPVTGAAKAVLATTWRQCQSNTCTQTECAGFVHSAAHELVEAFLTDRGVPAPAPLAAVRKPAEAATEPMRPRTQQSASVTWIRTGPGPLVALLFYSVYALLCLSLMLYWQIRKKAY